MQPVRQRKPRRPATETSRARTRRTARHGPDWHDRVGARLKGWLTWDGDFFVGPRYIRLLEAIDEAGTIRGACPGTGMSYRTCLNRIRQMERILGAPILTISRGGTEHGGARLTPQARELVRVYREWRHEVERASDRAFRKLLRS